MKKIIIGYDGSDQAKDALRLGAAVARPFDAHLLVASTIEFEPLAGTGCMELDAGAYNEAKAEYFDRLFAQVGAELGGAEFEHRALEDTATHGLAELAGGEQADLIVLGSTHHGPIRRVLAGTVAARLLHGAPCGVMVAPRGWSDHGRTGLDPIGVGYDGSGESKIALAHAAELAKAVGAKLRVITIAPYLGAGAHLEHVEAIRPGSVKRLSQGVESVSDEIATEGVLRLGREATELAAQGTTLGLLVVGSHGYGPLRQVLEGSVSGELVRTAPCPVLVVPRGAETPSKTELAATAKVA